MGHAQCLVMNEHQVLAKLTDFFLSDNMGVAEIKLRGIRAGFDEVVPAVIKLERFMAEAVNDGNGGGSQRAEINPGELEQGEGNLDDSSLRNRQLPTAYPLLIQYKYQPRP